MMYPRLFLARQLLREDGFIVISIDDAEFYNLRNILNELYGEENFIASLVYDRNRKNDSKFFSVGHEYMVVAAKNKAFLRENEIILRIPKEGIDEARKLFKDLRKQLNDDWEKITEQWREYYSALEGDDPRKSLGRFNKVDELGPYRDDGNINWPGGGGPRYEIFHPVTGKSVKKPRSGWRYPTLERMQEEIDKGNIVFGEDETTVPGIRTNLFEKATKVMKSVHYSYAQTAANEFDKIFNNIRVFDNPKHYADIEKLVLNLTEENDLILDFYAGSATSGHAILLCNINYDTKRRFILVQLPEPINIKKQSGKNAKRLGLETISAIGIERLKRAIDQLKTENPDNNSDMGFRVFNLSASNFKTWSGIKELSEKQLTDQMELFADPLIEEWNVGDVIAEIAIKEAGFGLNYLVKKLASVVKQDIHQVIDPDKTQSFYICLDERIKLDNLAGFELDKEDLFVCRAIALNDETTANLALQCRLKTI